MSDVGATADSAGDPEVVGSGQTQLCKSGREFGGTDRGVGGRVGEGYNVDMEVVGRRISTE